MAQSLSSNADNTVSNLHIKGSPVREVTTADENGKRSSLGNASSASKESRLDSEILGAGVKPPVRRTTRHSSRSHPGAVIYIGKANIKRDLTIAGVVVALFIYFGSKSRKKDVVPDPNTLESVSGRLTELLVSLAPQKRDRRNILSDPCDVFVAPSTIPNTGPALFAGRNYSLGQIVPLHIPSIDSLLPTHLSRYSDDSLWLPPYMFLIKHRPNSSNIAFEGNWTISSLQSSTKEATAKISYRVRVIRNILEGEELFVNYSEHPAFSLPRNKTGEVRASIFNTIPLQSHYDKARQVLDVLKHSIRTRTTKKSRPLSDTLAVRLVRDSTAILDPIVASLLPLTPSDISFKSRYHPYWLAFSSAKMSSILLSNQCYSDIALSSEDNHGDLVMGSTCSLDRTCSAGPVKASRSVAAGRVLVTIPLHILDLSVGASTSSRNISSSAGDRSCVDEDIASTIGDLTNGRGLACYGRRQIPLGFCPLIASLAFLPRMNPESQAEMSNVRLEWSPKQSPLNFTLPEFRSGIQGNPPGAFSWLLIASRDVRKGESVSS
jgi:hypothetical protein